MTSEEMELSPAQEETLRQALGQFYEARWAKELIRRIQQHSADEIDKELVAAEIDFAIQVLGKRFGEDEQAYAELLEKKGEIINAFVEAFGQQRE